MRNAHSFASDSFTLSQWAGTKFIRFQQLYQPLAPLCSVVPDISLVACLLCVKFADSQFLSYCVYPVVKIFLHLFFLFSKGYVATLPGRGLVRRH